MQARVAPVFFHDECVGATVVVEPAAGARDQPASAGYLGVVATISQSLVRDDPPATVLGTAVEGVARALDADHVAFVELLGTGELAVLAATGGQPLGPGPATGPFGSHVAFAAQSARPIVVRDFGSERRFDRGPLAGEQAAVSGVCAPVRWAGGGEGGLCVHSSARRLALTSADITFVQTAANLGALALARGRGA
jgi:GAF domain-containing protein